MAARSMLFVSAPLLSACTPTPPPAVPQAEVDVTPLGADTALAVAPMVVTAEGFPADGGPKLTSTDYPGALTMIVKRTPEGLRLIHEHHSVRAMAPAKGA